MKKNVDVHLKKIKIITLKMIYEKYFYDCLIILSSYIILLSYIIFIKLFKKF